MTTSTPVLQFGACPRCEGPLAFHDDIYGPYWACLPCGYHAEAAPPSKARVDPLEAMKAAYTVFTYDGDTENFRGWRIRGLVLPAKERESYARYDLECPYDGCRQRQLRCERDGGNSRRGWQTYECNARHHIYIDLKALVWR